MKPSFGDFRWIMNPESFRGWPLNVFLLFSAFAASGAPLYDNLVDIRSIDPTIVVELRYATNRNIAGRALYPPELPALVRPTTAARLAKAQKFLRARHYGLKIWDAYRPLDVIRAVSPSRSKLLMNSVTPLIALVVK